MKTNTKRKKLPIFIIIVIFLLIAIFAIFARTIFNYIDDLLDEMNYQRLLREHPLGYSYYVERYADFYDIDPFLVYAVIKTESDFRADAVSNMGARGLMQIMEDTFDWISRYRIFERDMVFDDMFKPHENIRFGCYLISYHLENFDGDVDCSLAAYFAGDNTVLRWLSNPEFSSDGKTLDEIPDPDTRHYINKVRNAYENYIMLYTS
jgi:soluble lytic murein transglycosylase